jgi:hypothetical protein
MSREQTIAEIDHLLLQGDLGRAEALLRSIRWGAPHWPPALRQQALISLIKGEYKPALASLTRLAAEGDMEDAAWLAVAEYYAGQPEPAFTAAIFFGQLAIERLRRSPYMDYPIEVTIETLTVCNASCTFCPYPTLERRGEKMGDALIDKILGDLEAIPRELPFGISPFKVNDPLIDKRIFDICRQINRRLPNARPRLFTNGSPLTDAIIGRVAEIDHLQHLWISLNEFEAEAYQSVMGLPLARTLARMDRLHQAVESGHFPHPVIVSRVRDRSAKDMAFVDFVRQRYPRFSLSVMPYASWAGQIESSETLAPPPTGCGRWFELSIMSTGQVALCCMDGEGKHVIGDVSKDNALAIYNSPSYRRLRQDTVTRLEADFPCNQCFM